jgi:hypothetical protein
MIETYKTIIQEDGVYIIKIFKVQATTYRPLNCDLFFYRVYYKCEGSKAIINWISQILLLICSIGHVVGKRKQTRTMFR